MDLSSKTEDRSAPSASLPRRERLTEDGDLLGLIGDVRRFRQHFQARSGEVVEVDGILTTHEELQRLPEREQPRWTRVPIGPLVLMLRLTD